VAVRLDLPLDSHLHTDFSPDADAPLDAYAALAREQGVLELAITDHLDFDPGDPAYALGDYERRRRAVQEAAERWAGEPLIRFGAEITYERRLEETIRDYLADHPFDYLIGSIHASPRGPFRSREAAAAWCAGKTHREASGWYWDEAEAAIHSGLFDTIGHLDVVKRWMFDHLGPFEYEPHADLYERLLVALIKSGVVLELNSSGLRHEQAESYPPAAVVERFRALGGERVTAGTDAHQIDSFGFGLGEMYRTIGDAGFRALSFRRGGDRVLVDLSRELVVAAREAADG
jgi:histidinol-phosphatase (PHP family)